MAIDATNPSVVSATFDSWAITSLVARGDGLATFGQSGTSPVTVDAVLVKYRVRPSDSVQERSPLPGDIVSLSVPDLYALAAEATPAGQAAAAALSALTAAVVAIGQGQGKL